MALGAFTAVLCRHRFFAGLLVLKRDNMVLFVVAFTHIAATVYYSTLLR